MPQVLEKMGRSSSCSCGSGNKAPLKSNGFSPIFFYSRSCAAADAAFSLAAVGASLAVDPVVWLLT